MIEIDVEKKMGVGPGSFVLKVKTIFPTNQITQISGPSGVGKSTLLKILSGLILPDSGTIKFDQTTWFDKDKNYSKKIQDRGIGFVFQDYALFPNMTVEQHLRYGTAEQNYIGYLLELGEMTLLKDRYPKQLSGGQQQRLSILRALSTKPRLLLMDEPFAALDFALKTRIIEKLKALFETQNTTVIMVTHHDNEWGSGKNHIFNLKGE